jgi:very-short-patch-repair endonuclease
MRRRARFGGLVFEKPGASGDKLALARAMRGQPTAAEAALWSALRQRRLDGWKFRRQHVIAGYIVDFYCPELRLAVEVDGMVHQARGAEDRQRDEHLTSQGVQVVRVRNADVLERLDAVVDRLLSHCCESASRRATPSFAVPPPPRGGGLVGRARHSKGGGC